MGYEIRELSGSSYHDGDKYIVDTFIPDDTLPVGVRIVSGVRKPLILKDGVMVQAPSVTVRQNFSSESEDNEKLDLSDRIKELSQARQQIVETTTEVVSEHKAKKNRDDAMRRAAASGQTAEQSLDYYSQGIKHVYNRDNKYGKVHENASDALVRAVE